MRIKTILASTIFILCSGHLLRAADENLEKLSFPILPNWYMLVGQDDTRSEFVRFRRYNYSGRVYDNVVVLTCWKDNSDPVFEFDPPLFYREEWRKHTNSKPEKVKIQFEGLEGNQLGFQSLGTADQIGAFMDIANFEELYTMLEFLANRVFTISFEGVPPKQRFVPADKYYKGTEDGMTASKKALSWQDVYLACQNAGQQ